MNLDGLDSVDLVPAFWLAHYDDVEFVSTVQTALPGVVHLLRTTGQCREHVFAQPCTGAGVRVVLSHDRTAPRRAQIAEIGPRGLWDAIVLAIGAAYRPRRGAAYSESSVRVAHGPDGHTA